MVFALFCVTSAAKDLAAFKNNLQILALEVMGHFHFSFFIFIFTFKISSKKLMTVTTKATYRCIHYHDNSATASSGSYSKQHVQ